MSRKITFIIVEKSYIIRSGLKQIITAFPETISIKEKINIDLLANTVKDEKADVLIINAKLFDIFPEDIAKLRETFSDLKMIIFTGTKRNNDKFPYFDLKISVDEPKNSIINKLQELIKSIKNSEYDDNNEELSEREKEVVKQIALGKTNKEIGEELFISPHTVITHRKNITRKLSIKTVSGLTVYAILNNLIKIEEAQ